MGKVATREAVPARRESLGFIPKTIHASFLASIAVTFALTNGGIEKRPHLGRNFAYLPAPDNVNAAQSLVSTGFGYSTVPLGLTVGPSLAAYCWFGRSRSPANAGIRSG